MGLTEKIKKVSVTAVKYTLAISTLNAAVQMLFGSRYSAEEYKNLQVLVLTAASLAALAWYTCASYVARVLYVVTGLPPVVCTDEWLFDVKTKKYEWHGNGRFSTWQKNDAAMTLIAAEDQLYLQSQTSKWQFIRRMFSRPRPFVTEAWYKDAEHVENDAFVVFQAALSALKTD